jgi:hypothetical protein
MLLLPSTGIRNGLGNIMIDSLLSWLSTLVNAVGAIFEWLGDIVQRLASGTLLDLRPLQMAFVAFLLWLVYRIAHMFMEIFVESWNAHGPGTWDKLTARLFTVLTYGSILFVVILMALFFLLALAVDDPIGRLLSIAPG